MADFRIFMRRSFRNILAIPRILSYILFIDLNIRKLGMALARSSNPRVAK